MERRWFAANTRPRAERVALLNLARQGYRTVLPQQVRTVRHARKFHTVLEPLFPGYVFIELDPSRDRWRSVNGTRGIVALVTAGGDPVPVPEGAVAALQAMTDDGGVLRASASLQPGDAVILLSGPFANQLGTLERLSGKGRVQVLLDMMGTTVRIVSETKSLVPA